MLLTFPEPVSVVSNLCLLFTTAISSPLLRSSPCQSASTSPSSLLSLAKLCTNLCGFFIFPSQIQAFAQAHISSLVLSPSLTASASHSVPGLAGVSSKLLTAICTLLCLLGLRASEHSQGHSPAPLSQNHFSAQSCSHIHAAQQEAPLQPRGQPTNKPRVFSWCSPICFASMQ